ncbi:sulfite exporter TauE/SafE family protein [Paraburkholderia jirisanensis]
MRSMNTLTIGLTGLLLVTFLGAGLVKGVTGMGLPTVAIGVLGAVMSPLAAAAILIIPSFVTNVWQMLVGRHTFRLMRRLWSMMLCIVVGTVLGSRLLVIVDPVWSGRTLGIALIAYAVYALLSPTVSTTERLERWLSPIVGIVTGVVTGATGVFVIPAVPYLQSLGLQKDELVQALGLSFTVSTVALAAGLLAHGAFRIDQIGLSLMAVLPALVGMWLGSIVRQRISPKTFRRCFLFFLVVLGLELALRPFS